MTDSLMKAYLRHKYPQGSDEYLAQREALLQDALAAYARRSGKVCQACKEFKSLSEYGSDSSRPDGLTVYCRQCRR